MRVLVTGGAGFIGSHFCERLVAEQHDVDIVDDLSRGNRANLGALLDHERARLHVMSVLDDAFYDLVATHPFDVVVHLAAHSDTRSGNLDRSLDLERTFQTTVRVCEALSCSILR